MKVMLSVTDCGAMRCTVVKLHCCKQAVHLRSDQMHPFCYAHFMLSAPLFPRKVDTCNDKRVNSLFTGQYPRLVFLTQVANMVPDPFSCGTPLGCVLPTRSEERVVFNVAQILIGIRAFKSTCTKHNYSYLLRA